MLLVIGTDIGSPSCKLVLIDPQHFESADAIQRFINLPMMKLLLQPGPQRI
jgi:hypothetical protein